MPIEQNRFNFGPINLSAIFIGAVVALVVDMAFMLLGSAVGFAAIPFSSGLSTGAVLGASVYAVVTAIASFFIGGYVTTRCCGIRQRWDAAFHGVASFCLATVVVSLFMGSALASTMGAMAGQSTRLSSASPSQQRTPSQIITDLKNRANRAGNTDLSPGARDTVNDASKGAAVASLASLVLLAIGAASGGWGGISGGRASLRTPRTMDLQDVSDRAA